METRGKRGYEVITMSPAIGDIERWWDVRGWRITLYRSYCDGRIQGLPVYKLERRTQDAWPKDTFTTTLVADDLCPGELESLADVIVAANDFLGSIKESET